MGFSPLPHRTDEFRTDVQPRKFGPFKAFALAGQHMGVKPAAGTAFAADRLQAKTTGEPGCQLFPGCQLGQFRAELGCFRAGRQFPERSPGLFALFEGALLLGCIRGIRRRGKNR